MRFALVDCNNFYCSCERVFNPRLIGVPLVVLSNNDGCVIARSEESKKLGVEMGAPAFKNGEMFKKNGIQMFSSNYALYGDMSARVMNTMRTMVEHMEVYSIDEAFLALDAFQGMEFARELRARVRQWTGIPVSVGIGPTKTLAKLGNRYAKKNPHLNGVFDLTTVNPDEILAKIECQDIWGIGRRTASKLAQFKINTALDLKNADTMLIRNALGVVGERIARELNGISCMEVTCSIRCGEGRLRLKLHTDDCDKEGGVGDCSERAVGKHPMELQPSRMYLWNMKKFILTSMAILGVLMFMTANSNAGIQVGVNFGIPFIGPAYGPVYRSGYGPGYGYYNYPANRNYGYRDYNTHGHYYHTRYPRYWHN
jgi:hypothetical protein